MIRILEVREVLYTRAYLHVPIGYADEHGESDEKN